MPEKLDWMEPFFALACLIGSIVIALMIVLPIHPGARAGMQHLAVPLLQVLEILEIVMNTF